MMRTIVYVGLVLAATAIHGATYAEESRHHQVAVDIDSPSLDSAVVAWAEQTGYQVLISDNSREDDRPAPRILGRYTPEGALKILLASTDLRYVFVNSHTVAIRPTAESGSGHALSGQIGDRDSEGALPLVAQNDSSRGPTENSDSQKATKNSPLGEIPEVLVTATKREERAQDIPLSIAVVDSQDIEKRGLVGMEDYLRSIPGANQVDRGGKDNTIIIRGINVAPEIENSGSGPTVATYFGETPITGAGGTGAGGIDVRPVDIDHIEVLRGPQGTMFGSASLSGAVRVLPAKPALDGFSAHVATDFSNTSGLGGDNSMVQGVVNVPVVSDTLAVRAVGYRYDDSGFYKNVAGTDPSTIALANTFNLGNFVSGFVENDVGRMITTGGRAAALWKASDNLTLSLNFLTQKIKQDGQPFADVGPFEQVAVPNAPDGRLRGEAGDVNDTRISLSSATLNYDAGWGALTSVVSYIDSGSGWASSSTNPFLGLFSSTVLSDFKSVTAEARVTSQFQGPFRFLAGLFYEHVYGDQSTVLNWAGAPAPSPIFLTNPMYTYHNNGGWNQRAVFGEFSYDLTERLTATVGDRYYKYVRSNTTISEGGLVGVPFGTGVPVNLDSNEAHSNYKASLSLKLSKNAMLYTSWSQGFRLGLPQPGLPSSLCDTDNDGLVDGTNTPIASTQKVLSDSLDNYEFGGKFSLGRRMVVDFDVYHIKWKNMPITVFPGLGHSQLCSFGYTANAGGAKSDGVELQATVLLWRGMKVDFGGGFTNARLSEAAPGVGPLNSPAPEGSRLPGSPRGSANIAAEYDFNLGSHRAFVRADSFYTGKFYGDVNQTPGLAAGDYVKVDARAGLALNALRVELFIKNLTNSQAFTWRGGFANELGADQEFSGFQLRPRTFGAQLIYDFTSHQ
jgi:iron complex outermembrane recepter protein